MLEKLKKHKTDKEKGFERYDRRRNIAVVYVFLLFSSFFIYKLGFSEINILTNEMIYYFLAFFAFVYTSFELTLRNRKYVWRLFIFLSFVFYVSSFWALFNSTIYASILRTAGYGGGVRIELHYAYNNLKNYKEVCYLLIKTKEVLICMDEGKNYISEIPLADIDKISYRTVERTLKTYQLPEYNPH